VNDRPPLVEQLLHAAVAALPPNVALMHLLLRARRPAEADDALVTALQTGEGHTIGYLRAVARLWADHPDAWDRLQATVVDHHVMAASPDEALARWSAVYDRIAAVSPEAGVALYALGNPELLKAATKEIVDYLRVRELLYGARGVIEIGCGIGRLVAALAPEVRSIAGIDISEEMIREARRRCAAHNNVRLLRGSGKDLAQFESACVDLILAVDVFPYMVQTGAEIGWSNVSESARVLRLGGTLAIFNFSYRGDIEQDRAEVAHLAERAGFAVAENGIRPFKLWDGASFLLVKRVGD
jgi:SAM-dependent methyltransferase